MRPLGSCPLHRSSNRVLPVLASFVVLASLAVAAQADGISATVRKGQAEKREPRLPGAKPSDDPYQTPSLAETTVQGLPEKNIPLYRKYPADQVVVGEVGDAVLTREELNRMAASKLLMVSSRMWVASGDEETNERDRENRLIQAEQEVLYEWAGGKCLAILAERRGLRVSDEEVSEKLAQAEAETAAKMGGDKKIGQTQAALGIHTGELRRQMKEAILVDKYVLSEIERNFRDEDLRAIYDSAPGRFATPRLYRTWQILKRPRPDMTDKDKRETRKNLAALRKTLDKGGLSEFQAAARAESHDQETRVAGGDLGWLNAAAASSPEMKETLMNLAPGRVSDIVETRAGLHLFTISEIREAAGQTYDSVARQRVVDELVFLLKRGMSSEIIRDPSLNVRVRLNSSGLRLLDEPAPRTSRAPEPKREKALSAPKSSPAP